MTDDKQNGADEGSPESSPASSEKASDTKQSNNSFENANVVAQGDHTKIYMSGLSYADVKQIVKDFHDNTSDESSRPHDVRNFIKQEVAEALQAQRRSAAYMDDTFSRASLEPVDLPTTPEEIGKWFYQLPLRKQYVIQAVAILHGGRTHEINQLREELYQPLRESLESQESTLPEHVAENYRLQSSSELYEQTYTEFRIVGGVERIFWRDTDGQGNSVFSIHILDFLAQEARRGGWTQNGQTFAEAARRWAENAKGDAYWRAARATGVIWRSQDREHLQRIANVWANDTSLRDWRRAASFLYGAYEFECLTSNEQEDQNSFVIGILKQWVDRAHAYSNIYVGCAAAYTYGLMSRRAPQLALRLLDELLAFPLRKGVAVQEGIPVIIFAALVSNYVNMIWNGNLRLLLQHIAKRIEELVRDRRKPERLTMTTQLRFQRTIALEVMFTVFSITASTSFVEAQETGDARLGLAAPLEEPATIPDSAGRDTVLVGLLTKEKSGWRCEVAIILCGAILEKKSQLAFDFLQLWAKHVLAQEEDEDRRIYASLLKFFIRIERMLGKWSQGLEQAGFGRQNGREAYWHHLAIWCQGRTPLSEFARDVKAQIERQAEGCQTK